MFGRTKKRAIAFVDPRAAAYSRILAGIGRGWVGIDDICGPLGSHDRAAINRLIEVGLFHGRFRVRLSKFDDGRADILVTVEATGERGADGESLPDAVLEQAGLAACSAGARPGSFDWLRPVLEGVCLTEDGELYKEFVRVQDAEAVELLRQRLQGSGQYAGKYLPVAFGQIVAVAAESNSSAPATMVAAAQATVGDIHIHVPGQPVPVVNVAVASPSDASQQRSGGKGVTGARPKRRQSEVNRQVEDILKRDGPKGEVRHKDVVAEIGCSKSMVSPDKCPPWKSYREELGKTRSPQRCRDDDAAAQLADDSGHVTPSRQMRSHLSEIEELDDRLDREEELQRLIAEQAADLEASSADPGPHPRPRVRRSV